eukprot:scaffold18133_cov137-Isochrysis_galbana.AAC.1
MVARGSRGARMLATMSAGSGSSSIMGEPYIQFSTEDGKEHLGCVHDAVRDVYHPKDANNIDVAAMEKAIKASPEILARLAATDDSLFVGPICSAMLKIVRAIAPRPGASRLDAADEAAAAIDAAAAAAAAANATEHIAAVTMDNANADDIIRCSLNARTRSGKHKQMELRHPSSTMRAHTYPRTSAHPCLREHASHVSVKRRAEARDDLDARQQIEPAVEGEPRANEVGVVVNGVDVNVGVGGSERFEDANGVGDVEYCREDGVALDTTCLAGCQALIQCQALALHIYGGRAE